MICTCKGLLPGQSILHAIAYKTGCLIPEIKSCFHTIFQKLPVRHFHKYAFRLPVPGHNFISLGIFFNEICALIHPFIFCLQIPEIVLQKKVKQLPGAILIKEGQDIIALRSRHSQLLKQIQRANSFHFLQQCCQLFLSKRCRLNFHCIQLNFYNFFLVLHFQRFASPKEKYPGQQSSSKDRYCNDKSLFHKNLP